MKIEREIMCEKLKGLYGAFDSLLGSCGTTSQLTEKLEISHKYGKILSESNLELNSLIDSLLIEKEGILKDCREFLETKDSFLTEKEHTIKLFREKYLGMQSDLTRSIQEREVLKIKNVELEFNLSNVSEAFRKLRDKVKLRFANASEIEEEKYCSKCNKTYIEHNNFNWSCRTHLGAFQENTYWCCGKQGKDAPGCIISKHMSKEETTGTAVVEASSITKFCIGCKKHGHCMSECPKDPNIKTKADIQDEISRLKKLHVPKRKISAVGIQGKFNVEEFNSRMNAKRFEQEISSGDDESYDAEGARSIGFSDLMGLKEELDLDEKDKWFHVDMVGVTEIGNNFRRKHSQKRRTGLILTKHFSSSLEEDEENEENS